jgi:hypothetical protein
MIVFKKLGYNGRLGNQLFQIASTIGIAIKNNQDFAFPEWKCSYSGLNYSEFFENRLPLFENFIARDNYKEKSLCYDDVKLSSDVNLIGYFQSEKYFSHCKHVIDYYFKPKNDIIEVIRKKYDFLLNVNNCFVHVRRTDYVNNKHHYVCNEAYYQEALRKFNLENKDFIVIVFSDDIEWCEKTFKKPIYPYNFYFINQRNYDIEDLFLMSLCNNSIMSNSTFSWWGSYFIKNKNKKIYVPNIWFPMENKKNNQDIYRKDMIKL